MGVQPLCPANRKDHRMSSSWSRRAPQKRVAAFATSALLVAAVSLIGVASAQASTLPTLTLTLTKTSITVGGTTQSGGVNVVTTATGGVKEGLAVLFAIKPG